MRLLYTLLFYLCLPLFIGRLWWRGRRFPAYRRGLWQRFGIVPCIAADKKTLWIHAVSVGEAIAVTPLVRLLQTQYPDYRIVVTSVTPTGAARVRESLGHSVLSVYAPYDVPSMIRRFLRRTHPSLCLLVETELWPNYLACCQQKKIPVLLFNARLSERSMQRYRRYRWLTHSMMQRLSCVMAQYTADAQRFIAAGVRADRVQVTGNVKFDVPFPTQQVEKGVALRAQLGLHRPVWIAASTHDGEEAIIFAAHAKILAVFPEAILILVPRHPPRFSEVCHASRAQFRTVTRSTATPFTEQDQVYLGDTMGEMFVFFAASDIAFVGGSLNDTGGHNMLEPALLKKPILSGPCVRNFSVIAEMLITAGGMQFVRDAETMACAIVEWMRDSALACHAGECAYSVVECNRGAIDRQLKCINAFI